MQKLTHSLPKIRVDEETRKTWEVMALKQRRELHTLMQLIAEDIAILYRKTGVVFSVSKKTSQKNDIN